MTVLLYSTPTCPFCHKVMSYLTQQGVSFIEKDVSVDMDAQEEMIQKTGQYGVPVLDIEGTLIVGFDEQRIQSVLNDYL